MAPAPALVAIGHATSGCIGTAISTAALAPLDLVTTRLKAQQHLRRGSSSSSSCSSSSRGSTPGSPGGGGGAAPRYDGILDAFRAIMANEGGVSALYSGLGSDVAKSIIDSFLFFGFYNYLTRRRRSRRPGVAQELATGAFAGACARALTTPLSNAVTRKQVLGGGESLWATFASIVRESGVRGLWSGYSATVVLSLNPGITFLINGRLASRILPALEEEDVPIAWVAFLLAATSKAAAVALTYPFQAAKTRLQMPPADVSQTLPRAVSDLEKGQGRGADGVADVADVKDVDNDDREKEERKRRSRLARVWNMTIFSVVYQIMRSEGVATLYGGLRGELLKSFFAHGLTMLTKGLIHRWVIRCWYFLVPYLREMRRMRAAPK
ncbi:Peroxisomal adenine nucleotide carrier 2 [Escovopsis weberi]|uniref:Peroxisomal adenine nucleotide carrier 2 n=1 Tax=Escovopsis weberi TaxID=150374 RepID=A0A0M8N1E0_ESCWE|nr:Peroxisomal adenine nucleotide carrier 2 [Escovopsis weberi]